MDILVASNNKNKLREIRQILQGKFDNIYSLKEVGIDVEVEENGTTFLENADIKAKEICKISNMICLSDDSGLSVQSLDGAPGVYSARYGGIHGDDINNIKTLLHNLQGAKNRDASFISVVSLCFPNGKILHGFGEIKGYILDEMKGDNGFGYDPIFYSYELKKSMGEATEEEKNSVSHRFRALTDLLTKLWKTF